MFLAGSLALAQENARSGSPVRNVDDVVTKIMQQGRVTAKEGGQLPVVIGARIGEQVDRTRFVVELSDPLPIRTFTLSNPDRVVVDMPAVQWHLNAPVRLNGSSAVKSYRYGLFRPGNSRFVIDLN